MVEVFSFLKYFPFIQNVKISIQCAIQNFFNSFCLIYCTNNGANILDILESFQGRIQGVGGLGGQPPPPLSYYCSFVQQLSLPVKLQFSFVLFYKVFTENIYKIQVTKIYNLFLLLSAQTCCKKWLSKCWKCHALQRPKN